MNKRSTSTWSLRFARGVILWLVPVTIVWLMATPFYNTFLTKSTENLVRLTESPKVTRLLAHETPHYFLVSRTDIPSSKGWLKSVRITDTHFPVIMMVAFFLAVPGVPWRKRLENLSYASLIMVFFHIISLFFWVKFVYTTQLGAWSAEHYSTWQINFWGMSKHLLDLPFKFAMPLLLWAGFYIGLLLRKRTG